MKRNKITLLLAAFLLVCGCSDFEEINVNPNNPRLFLPIFFCRLLSVLLFLQ